MTFTPTPKGDLEDLDDLYDDWVAALQQAISRMHHLEQGALWAAAQIADLYGQLDTVLDGSFTWKGGDTTINPGLQGLAIANTNGNDRVFAVGVGDGTLDDIGQGSIVVFTDDPTTPPITTFRQYTVTSDITDHGSWVVFNATRIATFGTPNTPPVGSQVRLIVR